MFSGMLVNICKITQHHISEESNLQGTISQFRLKRIEKKNNAVE
jgi:hypothetical protein